VVTALPPGELAIISDTDKSHYFGSWPQIDLEKHTNGEDADQGLGPFILLHHPVTWTYMVTNTGNVTMTQVQINDDPLGPVSCDLDELAPEETMTCTEVRTAETEGQYENEAIVTAKPPDDLLEITDSDLSHYFGARPAITITKFTNGQDAKSGTGPFVLAGDTVTWTYIISNTRNVTLTNIF
jgi:hypothetical protein